MKRAKRKRILVAVIAAALAVLMILGIVVSAVRAETEGGDAGVVVPTELGQVTFLNGGVNDGRIAQGVFVDILNVSGLTVSQAEDAVNNYLALLKAETLTIAGNGQTASIAVGDLGFTWDSPAGLERAASLGKRGNLVERYKFLKDAERSSYIIPLTREVDSDAVAAFLRNFAAGADQLAVEPCLALNESGQMEVREGRIGTVINEAESAELLKHYLTEEWKGGDAYLDLLTYNVMPTRSADELYQVKDLLGSGTTDYSGSSPDRCQNIENGVRKINGTVVEAGERFSLTEAVTPFTAENGYAPAPSFEEGETVDTYGGGICQVSTTLYQAVLGAELEVVERFNHSMLVAYIPPSMDAAIAEGYKDMAFINNTGHPIYILGSAADYTLHFEIYGVETRDPNRIVTYESEEVKKLDPTDSITTSDELEFGIIQQTSFGVVGAESRMWKVITWNGETKRELINEDTYQMVPISYIIGIKNIPKKAVKKLNAAIEDGLINPVADVITKYHGFFKVVITAVDPHADPNTQPSETPSAEDINALLNNSSENAAKAAEEAAQSGTGENTSDAPPADGTASADGTDSAADTVPAEQPDAEDGGGDGAEG